MTVFGWCSSNKHKDCPRRYQRFIVNDRVTKKNPSLIILLDEWRECDCPCHERKQK